MKFTIKTSKLQEMVAKSIKGASNNKMLPITSLMSIELRDGVLRLITTDMTNYLYVTEEGVEGENFSVTIPVDTFSKLIARLTCENVTLEMNTNERENAFQFVVKGNGTYTIELPLDENGSLIHYPDPISAVTFDTVPYEVNITTIQTILETAKSALAAQGTDPACYTGYFIGDKVVATDTYKVCGIDVKLFDTPALISAEMMELLSVMTDEKIAVYRNDNVLVFVAKDCIVYGLLMSDIDDYAIDAIGELIESDFESMCKVSKAGILQMLDRLSLFVGKYDKNAIYLTFTKDGLQIDSKQSNGTEILSYTENQNFKDFTCAIDIEMLQSQIKAQSGEVVEIWYGRDNAIKMKADNITQIIALMEDDRA